MARPYIQYCPVAHSLELVGERWSLLIVRDLLKGPKRYSDLIAGLPGLGTNILAARLKELEEGEVIRKRKLPPPANCNVYELTEYGAELEEVIQALGRWGFRSLGPPPADCPMPEGWLVQGSRTMFDPSRAGDRHDPHLGGRDRGRSGRLGRRGCRHRARCRHALRSCVRRDGDEGRDRSRARTCRG
jgi:DNA-binding HxlR family transcriptional regulator